MYKRQFPKQAKQRSNSTRPPPKQRSTSLRPLPKQAKQRSNPIRPLPKQRSNSIRPLPKHRSNSTRSLPKQGSNSTRPLPRQRSTIRHLPKQTRNPHDNRSHATRLSPTISALSGPLRRDHKSIFYQLTSVPMHDTRNLSCRSPSRLRTPSNLRPNGRKNGAGTLRLPSNYPRGGALPKRCSERPLLRHAIDLQSLLILFATFLSFMTSRQSARRRSPHASLTSALLKWLAPHLQNLPLRTRTTRRRKALHYHLRLRC